MNNIQEERLWAYYEWAHTQAQDVYAPTRALCKLICFYSKPLGDMAWYVTSTVSRY